MKKSKADHSKVEGKVIGSFNGLVIYGSMKKAKKSGKDRIWIQVRQKHDPKSYRVSASLCYTRSVDILFETIGDSQQEEKEN